MIKNKKKNNTLIKKKNLLSEMRKVGINRVSPSSLDLIESFLVEDLNKIINKFKEEMFVNGKKNLSKEIVNNTLKKINLKEDFWEV